MGGFVERIAPLLMALVFLAAMLAAWGTGWRKGRRAKLEPGEDPEIKFTDAALALLGLLLAFTFSMSLGRHDQRRAMAIAESNAIGDFYTCASLLKEPNRSQLQDVVRQYVQDKLDMARRVRSESELEEKLQGFQKMHARMTAIVAEALFAGTPIAVPLTNTLNNVTSADASRLEASFASPSTSTNQAGARSWLVRSPSSVCFSPWTGDSAFTSLPGVFLGNGLAWSARDAPLKLETVFTTVPTRSRAEAPLLPRSNCTNRSSPK